jgi:uncharacterized membrane protein SpoIIM required for sporulation
LAVSSSPKDDKSRPQQIGHTVAEISEKASLLVREEIALAKAEVTQKATKLGKGAAVAAIAGVFATLGLIFLLFSLAWFFAWVVGSNVLDIMWGHLIVTGILFLFATIAGLIGLRWIKKGSPPTPDMAIEEAKAIRDTVSSS